MRMLRISLYEEAENRSSSPLSLIVLECLRDCAIRNATCMVRRWFRQCPTNRQTTFTPFLNSCPENCEVQNSGQRKNCIYKVRAELEIISL